MEERYIPSEDLYLAAFREIYPRLTSGHKAILKKLYEHCYFMQDNRRVRTWELSKAAGYKAKFEDEDEHQGKNATHTNSQ